MLLQDSHGRIEVRHKPRDRRRQQRRQGMDHSQDGRRARGAWRGGEEPGEECPGEEHEPVVSNSCASHHPRCFCFPWDMGVNVTS